MKYPLLRRRRRKLGMPLQSLVRRTGLPAETVKRILADPDGDSFGNVAAVATILGVDLASARKRPVDEMLRERAYLKAAYVAKLVQGTQGLEAAGLDREGYQRLIEVSANALLAGDKRKLWDGD